MILFRDKVLWSDGMKLVILGAGWLGRQLIEVAKLQGWQVQGTSRNPENHNLPLRKFLYTQMGLDHDVDLQQAYWVCAIPPKARHANSDYLDTLDAAISLANDLQCRGFLLCSSTGVYPELEGEYFEQSKLDSNTIRKKILIEAENKVLDINGKVLRLAGLVGPGREPGKFVAGKVLKSSSKAAVNMVHQQDVIDAIVHVLLKWENADSIYNVCYPWHPMRENYYQEKCKKLGTLAPSFEKSTVVKRIINGAAIEQLGFEYKMPI